MQPFKLDMRVKPSSYISLYLCGVGGGGSYEMWNGVWWALHPVAICLNGSYTIQQAVFRTLKSFVVLKPTEYITILLKPRFGENLSVPKY